MPRTLDEAEFNSIKDAVLSATPAGLSESDFYRYIGPKFQEALGIAENSPPKAVGSAVGRFLSGAGEMLNPVTMVKGAANAVLHPIDTAAGMLGAAGQQFSQAKDLYGQGRYVEAAGHAAAGALPIVGPAAAAAGEQIAGGDIAGGLGKGAGMLAAIVGPKMLPKMVQVPGVVSETPNAAEVAAVKFGQARGIPVDAATATGNRFVAGTQALADASPVGSVVATRAKAAQAAALERVGGELAQEANPGGGFVSPEQAGQTVTGGVKKLVGTMNDMADEAYGKLRKIEEDPQFAEQVHTAPEGSRAYQAILKKLGSGGAAPTRAELYGMRQIESELDAVPFSRRMLKQTEKGNSWEPVEGVGGAGAPVYHEVGQAMTEGGDLTRGEMQAAIKRTLETGEWNAASKGALSVVRKRQGMEIQPSGPTLNPEAPILGGVEQINLPVQLSGVRKALQPLYDRLKRESELVPLMGDKGRALTALDRLMTGPEHAPVSIVDGALGDLKSMARADIPELRTQGQGLAAQAVRELDKAVQAAAAKGGPEAIAALREGRSATVAKYQAGGVLEDIRAEPVQAFRQMTAPKDSGIEFLRKVKEMAPDKIPDISRAYLEDLLGTATAEGGFNRAAKLQADWQKLGPATKQELFGAGLTQSLDHFFLLAKRLADNPNPSGTALTLNSGSQIALAFTHPLTGIPIVLGSGAISKLLHSTRGVNALTRGIEVSLPSRAVSGATKGAALLNLVNAARGVGADLSGVPAMAGPDDQGAPK